MGDANPSNLVHGLNPAGGLVFRSNLNFRWAISSNIMVAQVYDDTENVENVFPGHEQMAFKNVFMAVAEHIEFNFLPYSDRFAYLDTYRFTPYVFAGLGATIIRGEKGFLGFQVPLGLGVRYKVKNSPECGRGMGGAPAFQR
ncbi:hypothetical protein AGMMS4957_10280 [Bacteroidia bacterium]|nr:hypothetical protein AGMMS4957_10280 [Bacteroidia bacterium]